MATQSVNASISMTANGSTRVNGTLSWTAPSLPEGSTVTGIAVSGTYTWGGKGNVTVYINGQSVTSGASFNVSLGASASSPYTIQCQGNNKNATGSNFSWGTLQVTYTYDPPPGSEKIFFKSNGSWVQISKAYKKVNGSWVEQSDLTTVFNSSTNYVKG